MITKIVNLTAATIYNKILSSKVAGYSANKLTYKGIDIDNIFSKISVLNLSSTATIYYCLDTDILDADIIPGGDGVGIIPSGSLMQFTDTIVNNIRLIATENVSIELIIS